MQIHIYNSIKGEEYFEHIWEEKDRKKKKKEKLQSGALDF